jgi:hypothetical protein
MLSPVGPASGPDARSVLLVRAAVAAGRVVLVVLVGYLYR